MGMILTTITKSFFTTAVLTGVLIVLNSVASTLGGGAYISSTQESILGMIHMPTSDQLGILMVIVICIFFLSALFHHKNS
jgi:type IV secretory pathway VirB2 component (pilin)